jgi:hypothetical protein
MWLDERGSEVLTLPECRRLLALAASEHRHGHLGIATSGAPVVVPVNYVVHGPDVLVLVGEGLFSRMTGQLVAFQIDGPSTATGPSESDAPWSVLLRGPALEEAQALAEAEWLKPEVSKPGHRLVRIRGDAISGRQLRAHAES